MLQRFSTRQLKGLISSLIASVLLLAATITVFATGALSARAGAPQSSSSSVATTLLMVHGFDDTCYAAFDYNPQSGPSPTSAYAFFQNKRWTKIDRVGYYSETFPISLVYPGGVTKTSFDGTVANGSNPVTNGCDSNVQSPPSGESYNCAAFNPSAASDITDPIRDLACKFAWYVYSTYTQHDISVDILAHSMGGLVVRDAITESGTKIPYPNNTAFPPAKLLVNHVVTVATPHEGINGAYRGLANLAYPNHPQEIQDMYADSPFMQRLAGVAYQDPQGANGGTFWGLIAGSVEGNPIFNCVPDYVILKNQPASAMSCLAGQDSTNEPFPDGDGVVQADSALSMKADYKVLYGAGFNSTIPFTPGNEFHADYSTQYVHGNECSYAFSFGGKNYYEVCPESPFYLNDGTPANQLTRAWVCTTRATCASSMGGINDVQVFVHNVQLPHSLAEMAALLSVPYPPPPPTPTPSPTPQQPQGFLTNPGAGIYNDGHLEAFGMDSTHTLFHIWQPTASSAWLPQWQPFHANSRWEGSPVALQSATGKLMVFMRDANQNVWWAAETPGDTGAAPDWSNFQEIAQGACAGFANDFVVDKNNDGRLEVFAVDGNGNLCHAWQTQASSTSDTGGVWSSWEPLGQGFLGKPAVISDALGQLHVFGVATNYTLETRSQTGPGAWSAWLNLGGYYPYGTASVAENHSGTLEVFGVGSGNQIDHTWQSQPPSPSNPTGTWSGEGGNLGGSWPGNPAAIRDSQGNLEVFAVGSTTNLYVDWQTCPGCGWYAQNGAGWPTLYGNRVSDPIALTTADDGVIIFVRGTDNAMWWIRQSPGNTGTNGWSGWSKLGG